MVEGWANKERLARNFTSSFPLDDYPTRGPRAALRFGCKLNSVMGIKLK